MALVLDTRSSGRRVCFEESASPSVAVPLLTAGVIEPAEIGNVVMHEETEDQNKIVDVRAPQLSSVSLTGRRSRSRRRTTKQFSLRFRSISLHSAASKRRHTLH